MNHIKVIIGLGNPGHSFEHTRHNIGFRVLDALAQKYHGSWSKKENLELCSISIHNQDVLLIKPQTFMNNSGLIMPFLTKKGIKPEQMLVVHDELEVPFGQLKIKVGGSHKGHNGLRSLIQHGGSEFTRLRFGIGRPADKDQVGNYVLQNFTESPAQVTYLINKSVDLVEGTLT